MKALIFSAGLEEVIAVVDGKNVHSINKGFVEMYIPKDETTVPMMVGLTKLALTGGTVSFEPNYHGIARGECVYVAVRTENVDIKWEDKQ